MTEAIHLGAIGFDAVKLIALAHIERRPARLDLAAYQKGFTVTFTTAAALVNQLWRRATRGGCSSCSATFRRQSG